MIKNTNWISLLIKREPESVSNQSALIGKETLKDCNKFISEPH